MNLIRTLNLKLAAGVAVGAIVLTTVLAATTETCTGDGFSCTPSPPPVVGALQAIAWLALLGVGVLALWRKFGPPPTDDAGHADAGDFGGYGFGHAGEAAYQALVSDAETYSPAAAPDGEYQQPAADFDFDDLFDRRRGGE